MSEVRKPLWPWIVALMIGLPILYVASFAPACWLTSQVLVGGEPEPNRAMIIYFPLGALAGRPETFCGRWICWWMTIGVAKGHTAIVPSNAMGTQAVAVDSRK